MKKILLISLLLTISALSYGLSPIGQSTVNQMINGGPISIRDAAKGMYSRGEQEQQVLDVLAEIVLRDYRKTDRATLDAMAWGSKALGASGNARYRSVLEEVAANGGHRKLRKYAKKSLGYLGTQKVKQYKKGGVSIKKSQAKGVRSRPTKNTPVKAKRGKKTISVVQKGMSMSEVYNLIGEPTATTQKQTGKAFIPFNFKGADLIRTISLYKGQGRVVFSKASRYDSTWRVYEVQVNPNESGYP